MIENNLRNIEIVTIILILFLIVQSIIFPSKATNTNICTIDTVLGEVTLEATETSLRAGDIVPIRIDIKGKNIINFYGYLNYDKTKFKEIDFEKDIEVPQGWSAVEGEDTEFGKEIFISADRNKYERSNSSIAIINFVVKEDTNVADFSIREVYIANTDFEDNLDEEGNLPSMELHIGSDTEESPLLPEKPEEPDIPIKEPEEPDNSIEGSDNLDNQTDETEIPNNPTEEPQDPDNINNPSILDIYLSSETYKIGKDDIENYEYGDQYISRIEKETTKEECINSLKTNGTIKIIKQDGEELQDGELVGTGMTIEVTKDNEKIELKIAVMGDLNGDGKVTPTDLSTVNQLILKIVELGNEYKIAADLDENEDITVTDLSTINKVLLETV